MKQLSIVNLLAARVAKFLFTDIRLSPLWLTLRVYIGWTWLHAGWEKLGNTAWTGDKAGTAIHGFVTGALQKTSGAHPDVQGWYADFLRSFVDNHTVLFSYLVTYGEMIVGIALILGLFTGLAALIGLFMNFNYLFAGTISINPVMVLSGIFLVAAWRTAGWLGLDYFVFSRSTNANGIVPGKARLETFKN